MDNIARPASSLTGALHKVFIGPMLLFLNPSGILFLTCGHVTCYVVIKRFLSNAQGVMLCTLKAPCISDTWVPLVSPDVCCKHLKQ